MVVLSSEMQQQLAIASQIHNTPDAKKETNTEAEALERTRAHTHTCMAARKCMRVQV